MSSYVLVLLLLGATACSSPLPAQPSSNMPIATAPAAGGATTTAQSLNQQLVFQDQAGTGIGTFDGNWTPFGFWIWCQTPLNRNAYGNDCAGSLYFYKLGITTGVNGSITSTGSGYSVTVSSTPSNGAVANCTFTLATPFSTGATNTVSLSCASPSGSGTDSKVAIQLAPATP
jgi:hypothetical protein